MHMVIRKIRPDDASVWEAMRRDLWPGSDADHAVEIPAFFAGTLPHVADVLFAEDTAGKGGTKIVGFAELSIRLDVVGLEGKRTAYVEGLYVRPDARGKGVARQLLLASRQWAREQACVAFASDRAERVIVDPAFGK